MIGWLLSRRCPPVLGMTLLLCAWPLLTACRGNPAPEPPPRQFTDTEKARMHKFRGIGGYELSITGTGTTEEQAINVMIYTHEGNYFAAGSGFTGLGGQKRILAIFPPGPPEWIEVFMYRKGAEGGSGLFETRRHAYVPPTPLLGHYKVPFAEHIPDALLDEIRKNGGQLTIKLRLHPDGVLVGWHIERRPGFNAEKSRKGLHYPPAYTHTGGDFCEERRAYYYTAADGTIKEFDSDLINGRIPLPPELAAKGYFIAKGNPDNQLRQRGWYIHPKTKERIETDF
jgi:hypothetical protein